VVIFPPRPVVARLKNEGRQIPKASFRALIDTGAESSSISQNEINSKGLVSRDLRELVGTSGEPELRPVYDVCLEIAFANRKQPVQFNFEVATIDLDRIGVYALIGRDILRHCEFSYHGVSGEFVLNFHGTE